MTKPKPSECKHIWYQDTHFTSAVFRCIECNELRIGVYRTIRKVERVFPE